MLDSVKFIRVLMACAIASLLALFSLWLLVVELPVARTELSVWLLSLSLFIISFFTFAICVFEEDLVIRVKVVKVDYLFWGWWLVSIILVALIQPFPANSYMEWSSIPVLNYVRALCAFMLTFIYPGFGLLKFLPINLEINKLEGGILSVSVSIFIVTVLGIIALIQGDFRLSFTYLLVLNTFFWVLSIKRRLFSSSSQGITSGKRFNVFTLGVFLGIILFYISNFLIMHFPDKFVAGYDQWRYYGQTLTMFDRSPYLDNVISYLPLHMLTGIYMTSSGLPYLNGYMLLNALELLPIFSFYLLSQLLLNQKQAIVATVTFSLFSGFGGIYALYLNRVGGMALYDSIFVGGQKAGDIFVGIHGLSFWYHAQNFGLAFLLIMLYLSMRFSNYRYSRLFILAMLFSISYWTHLSEAVLFVATISFLIIFAKKYLARPHDLPFSVAAGLLISISFAVVFQLNESWRFAPFRAAGGSFSWMPFVISTVVGVWFVFLRCLHTYSPKRSTTSYLGVFYYRLQGIFKGIIIRFHPLLAALLVYIYSLSFVFWVNLPLNFKLGDIHYIVPWYMYPVRLGVPLLLSLVPLVFSWNRFSSKVLKLGGIFALTPLLLGKVSSLLLLLNYWESPTPEARITLHMIIGLAIISAPFLTELIEKAFQLKAYRVQNKETKKLSFATLFFVGKWHGKIKTLTLLLLILLVFGSGITSVILYARSYYEEYVVRYGGIVTISGEDIPTMDEIRKLVPSSAVVLAPWPYSEFVTQFSGRYSILLGTEYPTIARPLMTHMPELFFDALRYNLAGRLGLKIGYLLLNNKMSEGGLSKDVGFLFDLRKRLPIIFRNEKITLLALPNFSPESENSKLVLLKPSLFDVWQNTSSLNADTLDMTLSQRMLSSYSFILQALSLANLNYTIRVPEDIKFPYDANTILTPDLVEGQTSTKLLQWIQQGGNLVVVNGEGLEGHRYFAKLLSITTNSTAMFVADSIESTQGTVKIPPVNVPMFASTDKEVRNVAFFASSGQPLSPYAFRKQIGSGSLLFIEAYPYFDLLLQNTNVSRLAYSILGRIVTISLPENAISYYMETPRRPDRVLLLGPALMTNVKINPESFFIPDVKKLNVSLDFLALDGVRHVYENVRLRELAAQGDVNFSFESPKVQIIPFDSGGYGYFIFPSGFNSTFYVNQDARVSLTIEARNETLSIVIQGGFINLKAPSSYDLVVMMKNAKVYSNGISQFARVQVDWTYGITAVGVPFEVDGSVKFTINGADKNMVLLSDLNIEGRYRAVISQIDLGELLRPSLAISSFNFVLYGLTTIPSFVTYIILLKEREKLKE